MTNSKLLTASQISALINYVDGYSDEIASDVYDVLYEYFREEMPYGVAKARTGDPVQWISNKLDTMTNAEIRNAFYRQPVR